MPFKQIDGCAMGSPIPSVTVELVLEEISYTKKCVIPFYFRYVDNCIAAVPKDRCNCTLGVFNSLHPKINFAIEIRTEKSINYLRISVIEEKRIKTKRYTKRTWSRRHI